MNQEYEIIIGLEVHAELSTKTKIYCNCENKYGAEVNTLCCPVCMGLPGALPVLNQKVVEYAIKMGHALHCKINSNLKQDRKNYIYPDLPKAYQISQFDIPLCENGYVDFLVDDQLKRVGITRIHIEEDAGKLLHQEGIDSTLVDLNRCGVPLIEIVSEPDLRSAKEAREYLETIKTILQYLDISDCKMQEGSIRCDVNVSVRPIGQKEFGTRCEMKNINTFSGAMRAIEYEANRQIKLLQSGGAVEQQTRRWDDSKGENFLLRSKEDAQDYRYFQEPDVLPIQLDTEWIEQLKSEVPELPHKKMQRYILEYHLSEADAMIVSRDIYKARYFESCVSNKTASPQSIANWILGDAAKVCNERGITMENFPITHSNFTDLIVLVEKETISSTAAKKVFAAMIEKDQAPGELVKQMNLAQISDDKALESIVEQILSQFPQSIEDYRAGKTNALGFLVGQCMKATKGQANPKLLNQLLLSKLKG